ncbi:polysaccharide deacetylase family protein [Novosphingobium flavum]|uniref:Polysaccharide deacetylase family protein n=1 Tax=Novosphingobium aerophilum TaxID=2839843 RepID=A0A7X1F5B9_9SPHN|nr:polysaccharide deacetylase family protein [Novosphingobium aerophilum]MBC2662171.1 polysaccharide deacetylase family protein [Novosphingobium aerophilum]
MTDPPSSEAFVAFPDGFGSRFIVTVDTEEEFDWTAPFSAEGFTLDAVPELGTFQRFCEEYGVCPLYLIDYPIATSPVAAEVLGEAVRAGRADVGIQLHPWVNPPHDEAISTHNSFAGNLPEPLERSKLAVLRDVIERNFGRAPRVYRAGRYGVGPATAPILLDHGIAIDTSVRARFDYSSGGGQNFRDLPVRPWWVGAPGRLMELPLTTVFWGLLRRYGPILYPKLWRAPRLRGLLSRLGLLERIPLTPEGASAVEAIRGIDMALREGVPVLVFSFHSPSLQAGHTPYVRNAADLAALYDWWRTVFAELARRGVRPTSVAEIMAAARLA